MLHHIFALHHLRPMHVKPAAFLLTRIVSLYCTATRTHQLYKLIRMRVAASSDKVCTATRTHQLCNPNESRGIVRQIVSCLEGCNV